MAILGNKATLELGDITTTVVGRVNSVGGVEQSIGKVDVSALEDVHRKYVPGDIVDTSDIAIEGFYEKGDEGQLAMATAFASKAIETFTITYSDGAMFVLKGFIQALTQIGESGIDEGLPFSATIVVSEEPTYTPAVAV